MDTLDAQTTGSCTGADGLLISWLAVRVSPGSPASQSTTVASGRLVAETRTTRPPREFTAGGRCTVPGGLDWCNETGTPALG
jgi:hypothetical protein